MMMDEIFQANDQRNHLKALEKQEARLRQRVVSLLKEAFSRNDPSYLALLDDLRNHLNRIEQDMERVGEALARQRGRQTAVSSYLRASAYGRTVRGSKG
jgi:hypothetical protein